MATTSYDALNRVTVKTVPDACVASYACTSVLAAATRDVYYGYDLQGHQTAARFDSASGSDAVLDSYDGFGQLTSETVSMGGTSRTLGYQYDADGNRTRVTHPDGMWFGYGYDGLDRLTGIGPNATSGLAAMGYNGSGDQATETRGNVATAFGHDAVGRLASLADDLPGTAGDVTSTFAYNPASQMVTKTRSNAAYAFPGYVTVSRAYATNGLNQYTSAGSATFGYDANGNLTSDGTATFAYDAENRLVATGTGTTLSYDALGRLYAVATSGASESYAYAGDQRIGEYDASGTMTARYVFGGGEDNPLVWYAGAATTSPRALQGDHQGSIVSVVDASGSILAYNAYDEYGIPGSANLGRFQYTGQAWLPQLGLYYYKARIYSPTLGRFMQTDLIGYKDQFNLYAYVANDPVNHADPTGLAGDDDWKKRVVDVVIGTAKVATGAVLTAAGIAGDGASAAGEVATAGVATPVAVPAAVASTAVAATGIAMAADGAAQIGGAIMRSTPAGSDGGGSNDGGNSGKGGGQSSGGTPRNLGNLGGRASERAADVATSRGASGANVRQMGQWADKPLSEVARAAASGDRSAATALKIVKQASRLGQKY